MLLGACFDSKIWLTIHVIGTNNKPLKPAKPPSGIRIVYPPSRRYEEASSAE